ncbi:MAG: heparinase II/III family protein, partial [Kordiimonas sp.]
PNGEVWLKRGLTALEEASKTFILPDGGPASRNPSDAIRAMQLLIIVRNACVDTNSDLPPWVQITLDRIAPYIRAVRHEDGSLVQFGGASADGGHGVEAILAASDAKGKATENSAHAGIQRIQLANSCLIVDTGTPPAFLLSAEAHASTGAFEFSSSTDKIIVNVGTASKRGKIPQLAELSRTTAAHSTLVISNRNSTRILEDGRLGTGVTETLTIREGLEDGSRIKLMHDGYTKRFGVKHERSLSLTDGGAKLIGEDKLFGPKLKKLQGSEVIIRFHLHPNIEARVAPDGRITLETRAGKLWIFDTEDGKAEVEESLYVGHPLRPEPSKQIAVTVPVEPNKTPICKWVLSEMDSA